MHFPFISFPVHHTLNSIKSTPHLTLTISGYHLGEHGEWEKKSNFDNVVRVPLVIKPQTSSSTSSGAVVEKTYLDLVDIFPTLSSLAGLPPPPDAAYLDGTDLSALFKDPTLALKGEAFHQYPACGMRNGINETRGECNNTPKTQFDYMGYSVRNSLWRYTLWLPWNGTALSAAWDSAEYEEELYSHGGDISMDFDAYENVNLASSNPGVSKQLRARLRNFFHG